MQAARTFARLLAVCERVEAALGRLVRASGYVWRPGTSYIAKTLRVSVFSERPVIDSEEAVARHVVWRRKTHGRV